MLSKINFPDSIISRTKIMSEILEDLSKKKISELVAFANESGIDSSGKKDELDSKNSRLSLEKERKEPTKNNIVKEKSKRKKSQQGQS